MDTYRGGRERERGIYGTMSMRECQQIKFKVYKRHNIELYERRVSNNALFIPEQIEISLKKFSHVRDNSLQSSVDTLSLGKTQHKRNNNRKVII